MKVLVACEFSGVVRDAFIKRGHDAWSCDLEPPSLESPFAYQHIQTDVCNLLSQPWDLMIAHPPCTYLSNMSNCRINEPGRKELRAKAMDFFMRLVEAAIPKIAIENPRGFPERYYRAPDQIIQPWEFGHPQSKATCLWLKNLPRLQPTDIVKPNRRWDGKRWRTWVDSFGSGNAWKRSVTFAGIAAAMANQWSMDEDAKVGTL